MWRVRKKREICAWDTAKEWICTKHTPLFEIVHSTLHSLIFVSNTPHHIKSLLCPCKNRAHPSALSLSPFLFPSTSRARAVLVTLSPSSAAPPPFRAGPWRPPRRAADLEPRRRTRGAATVGAQWLAAWILNNNHLNFAPINHFVFCSLNLDS